MMKNILYLMKQCDCLIPAELAEPCIFLRQEKLIKNNLSRTNSMYFFFVAYLC